MSYVSYPQTAPLNPFLTASTLPPRKPQSSQRSKQLAQARESFEKLYNRPDAQRQGLRFLSDNAMAQLALNPAIQSYLTARTAFQPAQDSFVRQSAVPVKPPALNRPPLTAPFTFENRLKELLRTGQANVYALNIRTFGAEDVNRDGVITPSLGESGTFLRAEKKLDALKDMGFNVLHLLPILPSGRLNRLGSAGSVYAPSTYHEINPEYNTPGNGMNVFEEFQHFIQAAHQRGIHVMVDIPSCASEDLAEAHPETIAVDEFGRRLTPGDWIDIVAFANNQAFQDYMEPFFDLMNRAGVDGFRCDVARYRSDEFWQHFIDKYPEKGWFAESYVEEDDSPVMNIPRDRPWALLKDGFDSYYGQFHTFYLMTGQEYMDYLVEAKKRMLTIGEPRAFMGTFYTHDDQSLMQHGGVPMAHLCSAMMCLQPFTSPYIMDGYLTGDPEAYNIFDYAPPAYGEHPEIGLFLKRMLSLRQQLGPVVTEGSFTPIPVETTQPVSNVIAYTRNYKGKTLLVLANKDLANPQRASLTLPGYSPNRPLKDLIDHHPSLKVAGQSSQFYPAPNKLDVELEPGAIHAFFISAPGVEKALPTLYNSPDDRDLPASPPERRKLYESLHQPDYAEFNA